MSEDKLMSQQSLKPEEILHLYYTSLYRGELTTVNALMTEESYRMTLETFGLRLSLRDAEFKLKLKNMKEDPEALSEVEKILSNELVERKLSPQIMINTIVKNGDQRQTIAYTEEGKVKKLYFSKEENGWKINYYAGRKVG